MNLGLGTPPLCYRPSLALFTALPHTPARYPAYCSSSRWGVASCSTADLPLQHTPARYPSCRSSNPSSKLHTQRRQPPLPPPAYPRHEHCQGERVRTVRQHIPRYSDRAGIPQITVKNMEIDCAPNCAPLPSLHIFPAGPEGCTCALSPPSCRPRPYLCAAVQAEGATLPYLLPAQAVPVRCCSGR